MASFFQEEANKEFIGMMEKLLEDPPPQLMQKLASTVSVQQMSAQGPPRCN